MNGGDWIPFHRRLVKGRKRSIRRGVRFVLLELSLEARLTRGVIDLPLDRSTLNAVHDLLGGNRSEIRKALDLFTIADESGDKTIEIVRETNRHQLVLVKWAEWAGPKRGAERMRESRENAYLRQVKTSHINSDVTPTNSTEQTGERETRALERRLKSVPPPPPEPSEATAPELEAARNRAHTAEPGAVASGDSERPVELAERIWHELWEAKYKRPYEHTGKYAFGPQSEDQVLVRIAEKASIRGPGAETYLRHKIAAYLKDHGNRGWLDEHCHPLRCLEHDWVAYGEPKEPKRLVPRREEPVELLSIDEMAARAAAAMTLKIGNGGT